MQYCRLEDIIRYTAEKASGSEEVLQSVDTIGLSAIFMLQVKNRLFLLILGAV